VLEKEKLYDKLKKGTFFTNRISFLTYIVTLEGSVVDESKVEPIVSWPVLKIIHDMRSFHRLALFYRRFTKNFNTIRALIIEAIKGTSFEYNPKA